MTVTLRRLGFSILALWWLVPVVKSTLMVPLSIAELTRESDLVVHAKVVSLTTSKTAGGIITRVRVDILDVWKGTHSGNRLEITLWGGVLGTTRVTVDGQAEYRPGEEIVAFLKFNQRKEAVTVGLAQGKFVVWINPISGEKEVYNPFHGRTGITEKRRNNGDPESAVESLDALSLNELKRRVIQNSRRG